MKFTLKDIGVMQKAEFELADLTIICGKNNTGKTYVAYALYGFLNRWYSLHYPIQNESFFRRPSMHYRRYYLGSRRKNIFFNLESLNQLEKNGKCKIDIDDCIKGMWRYIDRNCRGYNHKLSEIFASSAKYFKFSSFSVSMNEEGIDLIRELKITEKKSFDFISISKKSGDTKIEISLSDKAAFKEFKKDFLENHFEERIISRIDFLIAEHILFSLFPKPFIISAERTGVAIFKNELNIARSKFLRKMGSTDDDVDLVTLYRKNSSKYALPIDENADFMESFETIGKQESFIAKDHFHILADFYKIVEGEYGVSSSGIPYYKPINEKVKLTMAECSSGVRASLILSFYLHHQVKKGDLLIIDEPELNLHPENQRRMARLFAKLINVGVKVFITTHSDYITSELSNLILLNLEDERIKKLAEEKGYEQRELLSHKKVKLYTSEPIGKGKINSRKYTLNLAKIDSESGIDAEIFNRTIDEMNEIKEEIFFG